MAPATSRTIVVDDVVVAILSEIVDVKACEKQKKTKIMLRIITLTVAVIKQMDFHFLIQLMTLSC